MTRATHSQSGFTLVEVMVTLSVLAILAALALPSFQGTIRSNRVTTENNQLLAALNYARTEAIKTRAIAEVCPSGDGATCDVDWNKGWIVWSDIDRDGTLTDASEVLRYQTGNPQLVVTGGAIGAAAVRFSGRGLPLLPAGTVYPANVITLHPVVCESGVEHVRAVQVARTGQVRTARGACP